MKKTVVNHIDTFVDTLIAKIMSEDDLSKKQQLINELEIICRRAQEICCEFRTIFSQRLNLETLYVKYRVLKDLDQEIPDKIILALEGLLNEIHSNKQ